MGGWGWYRISKGKMQNQSYPRQLRPLAASAAPQQYSGDVRGGAKLGVQGSRASGLLDNLDADQVPLKLPPSSLPRRLLRCHTEEFPLYPSQRSLRAASIPSPSRLPVCPSLLPSSCSPFQSHSGGHL